MARGATASNLREEPPRSLVSIMERLAGGDDAALFSLIDVHRSDLVRSVRAIAAKRNARLGADQIDDLVIDAALAIHDVAGAWRPDGAPPWFYAYGRIAQAVDRAIGQWADELDGDRLDREEPLPAAWSEAATEDVLAKLATDHEVVALLSEGLAAVASPRDRLVFVEHGVQVALGDPSPAVTIGRLYGMRPASVRQQTRRVKLRLRCLAETEPRYGELASLPLVA